MPALTGLLDLFLLPNLEYLVVNQNRLTGSISAAFANLTRLLYFDASNNMLSGTIGSWIGSLQRLEWFEFSGNALSGTIPPELGALSNLTALGLALNQLTGTIPPELGSLSVLTYMSLQQNTLTGTIPDALCQLWRQWRVPTNFPAIYLGKVFPSPSILDYPSSFTNIDTFPMYRLSVFRNRLGGVLPACMGNMTLLNFLQVGSNNFSGSLPDFGSSTNLHTLSASHNAFSGTVPDFLGRLQNLEFLDLDSNEFSGLLPSSLGAAQKLLSINISSNAIIGAVPESWGSLSRLYSLSLSMNQLTALPASIGNLSSLLYLFVASNRLVVLPASIRRIPGLVRMDISSNRLAGAMNILSPTFLPSTLNASFNLFTGLLPNYPASLDGSKRTYLIDISGNRCAKHCAGRIVSFFYSFLLVSSIIPLFPYLAALTAHFRSTPSSRFCSAPLARPRSAFCFGHSLES